MRVWMIGFTGQRCDHHSVHKINENIQPGFIFTERAVRHGKREQSLSSRTRKKQQNVITLRKGRLISASILEKADSQNEQRCRGVS